MNIRKVLNDVVPIKYAIPIAWGGLLAGVWIGYSEGRKVGKTIEEPKGSEEANAVLEEMKTLVIQMDFKFEEQQERFNYSIRQIARIINDLPNNNQRTFDDYAAELHVLEETSVPIDKRVDVTVIGSEWDQETEVSQRDPEAPYVIHRNEYFNDDMGYQSHATLTYYQGDDVLCDEHDTPIYNVHKIVGHLKFGHGSNDPSIVYIRNETLKAEYEVLLDPGMFQVEVLGEEVGDNLNDDLKHSHIRKFRSD